MTIATHPAGRWTECPACMAKDRMLSATAENYRKRIVDHASSTPLEREREDVAFARYRLAFHEWEQSIADHHAANGEATEEAAEALAQTEDAEAQVVADPDDDMPCMIDVHTPCTGHCCAAETDDGTAETEEMVAINKADAADELVNVYSGYIDKWLEALRERTAPQPTDAAPWERDAYEQLWYGDVPEVTLPPSFADLSPMTLTRCARAIGLYLRVLKRYTPADGYPSHVAHRLMDAFDAAAEARGGTLPGENGEEQ